MHARDRDHRRRRPRPAVRRRVPKQLLVVGGRPILERSVAAVSRPPGDRRSRRRAAGRLAADPPAYLRGTRRSRSASSPAARGGRIRWPTRSRPIERARPTSSSSTMRRGRSRAPISSSRTIAAAAETGAALAALPARDTVKRAVRLPAAVRRSRTCRRRDAAARHDLPRADAAGVPARRAARRAGARREPASRRPTRRRWPSGPGTRSRLVEGEPTNIKITTPDDLAMAEAIAGAAGGRAAGPRRHRLRPSSARGGPSADPRRRDDSVRARAARPLRRRRRVPRGHRRDPRRRGGRRHRPAFSRFRSAVEGRVEPRPAAAGGRDRRASTASRSATWTSTVDRSKRPKLARLHRRDAREPSRRRSASTSARVSIKGKTNEGVDAHRPRRGDRRPRGRAARGQP